MHLGIRSYIRAIAVGSLLIGAVQASSAQNGTVTGKVTDKASGQPVPGATIRVTGTTNGALSGEDGTYRLRGVGSGRQEVKAFRIGYSAATQVVTLEPGGTATADFAIGESAISLDAITVTAAGNSQATRESGASVAIVPVDSVNKAAVTNFTDVLTARVAGVSVQTSGGTTGTGSRVRIRGSNSISLNNDPLVIIDGVRVNSNPQSGTIAVGGQVPSRFDDLNQEDIEDVEVIKGPAASALYGTAAANGVLQITTRHGRSGKAQWNMHVDGGSVSQPYEAPNNYTTTNGCNIFDASSGSCQLFQDSLQFYNPLKASGAFVTGYREGLGINVGGGNDNTTYYVAGNFDQDQGVYEINTQRKVNLRTNIHANVTDNFDVTVNAGFLQSRLRLPQNDNNLFGVWANGLLGCASKDNPGCTDGFFFITPQQSFGIDTRQNIERFTGGGSANYRPLNWLTFTGIAGMDYTTRSDVEFQPPNNIPFGDAVIGNATSNPYQVWFYTANIGGTASYHFTQSLQAATSAGVQYYETKTHGTTAFGRGLVSGTGSVAGTAAQFAAGEQNQNVITFGWYLQEALNWHERIYANLALRGDENSAFGRDYGYIYYPSASLSWVIGEEPWFPKWNWLNAFRLRTAYGESGQSPAFRDAVSFYTVLPWQRNSTDQAGVQLGDPVNFQSGVGNANLQPERSREYELGFDAGLFRSRVGLEFTFYNKNTNDAIVQRVLPPSSGSQNTLVNIGQVNNKGWEASIDASVYKSRNFEFALQVLGNQNENKVVSLGSDTTPIIFGLGGATQRHAQGFPLGGFWQRPISYNDANHDGLLQVAGCPFAGGNDPATCEMSFGDNPTYIGSPFPKYSFAFSPRVQLFKYFQITALVERRSSYYLYNSTESFRCQFTNCLAWNDPHASLAEQARTYGAIFGVSDAGYIENASFWKWRELALTAFAPTHWSNAMHVRDVSLTVAVRNLHTWTGYTGLDPEISQAGADNFITADFLSQPPVRYWTARLNVTW
jgi:TonB-linked SusC/RagA family outer membrane protein